MTWQDAATLTATILVSLGGGGAIVAGVSGWLGKLIAERFIEGKRAQFQKDIEGAKAAFQKDIEAAKGEITAKLQRLQDELLKGQFVHRLQFETEFKLYQETWAALIQVRNAAFKLRPMWDKMSDKTHEEVKKERTQEIGVAFDRFTRSCSWNHSIPVLVESLHLNQGVYPRPAWSRSSIAAGTTSRPSASSDRGHSRPL